MRSFTSLAEFAEAKGEHLGYSPWRDITQPQVNLFADATDDHQWIHVDPERAAESPFGGTIAHGYLTLSLLAALAIEIGLIPEDASAGLNYGLDKVRFMTPVKAGARVRNRVTLMSVEKKGGGRIVVKTMNELQIEGEENPALIAETLAMLVS